MPECDCGGNAGQGGTCRVCGGSVPEHPSPRERLDALRRQVAEGRARVEREIVRKDEESED